MIQHYLVRVFIGSGGGGGGGGGGDGIPWIFLTTSSTLTTLWTIEHALSPMVSSAAGIWSDALTAARPLAAIASPPGKGLLPAHPMASSSCARRIRVTSAIVFACSGLLKIYVGSQPNTDFVKIGKQSKTRAEKTPVAPCACVRATDNV